MADPREECVKRFREFLDQHGYECKHKFHGHEMDDSQIMCLIGDLMGTFRRVSQQQEEETND